MHSITQTQAQKHTHIHTSARAGKRASKRTSKQDSSLSRSRSGERFSEKGTWYQALCWDCRGFPFSLNCILLNDAPAHYIRTVFLFLLGFYYFCFRLVFLLPLLFLLLFSSHFIVECCRWVWRRFSHIEWDQKQHRVPCKTHRRQTRTHIYCVLAERNARTGKYTWNTYTFSHARAQGTEGKSAWKTYE